MRTILVTLAAAGVLFAGQAIADDGQPVQLSPEQMDRVTAGVGVNNVGVEGWNGLSGMFELAHHNSADNGIKVATEHASPSGLIDQTPFDSIAGVAVPDVVRGSGAQID